MSQVALSSQLLEVAKIVRQVVQGVSLDKALSEVDVVLRPGVQSLSYYVLRYLGLGQALAQKLVKKAPPSQVRALLWCALALCVVQSEENSDSDEAVAMDVMSASPKYRPYVLVNEVVQATKMHSKMRNFAPLVNGVLRGFLRNRQDLMCQVSEQYAKESLTQSVAASLLNFQPWWVKRLRNDWTHDWQEILQVAQYPGPMTLRVNARQGTVEQAMQLLDAQGIGARVVGAHAIELDKAVPVEALPGFDSGYFSVQAAVAQLAAPLLLDVQWVRQRVQALGRPLRVLDACAAPGGKTAHMLEIMPDGMVEVLALDVDSGRLERVRQTLERIGLTAELRVADAAEGDAFCSNEMFDAILLDAPCTASGIVRRHPDIRWLRRETDIAELAGQQKRLLDALWPRLADQGRLLYCTCSVFKAEGEGNAQKFVLRHNKANEVIHRLVAPGHILPIALKSELMVPVQHENERTMAATDGFYYAMFEK